MCADTESDDIFCIEHFAPGRVLRVNTKDGTLTPLYNPGARLDGYCAFLMGDAADGVAKAHPNSPVSLARAPRQADGDQRCSERM